MQPESLPCFKDFVTLFTLNDNATRFHVAIQVWGKLVALVTNGALVRLWVEATAWFDMSWNTEVRVTARKTCTTFFTNSGWMRSHMPRQMVLLPEGFVTNVTLELSLLSGRRTEWNVSFVLLLLILIIFVIIVIRNRFVDITDFIFLDNLIQKLLVCDDLDLLTWWLVFWRRGGWCCRRRWWRRCHLLCRVRVVTVCIRQRDKDFRMLVLTQKVQAVHVSIEVFIPDGFLHKSWTVERGDLGESFQS